MKGVKTVKLWSKEALVLGGMYGVLETPFTYLGFEFITDILFVVFVGCVISLCFNKVPKIISKTMENYPKISYYLVSIGWIPYLIFIVTLILVGCYYYFGYEGRMLTRQIFYLGIFGFVATIVSLLFAYVKNRCYRSMK